jgi:hypothetical protein
MRSRVLSRFLLVVVACVSIGVMASDVFAQTQQLNKELVRKFPEGFCPLDTNLIGTFVTNTGIIQLTFVVGPFDQVLDDISIIEAAEFAAHHLPTNPQSCYAGDPEEAWVYNGTLPNAAVPFHESFGPPPTSPCPWDETDGFTISNGALRFAGGTVPGSTSVVISGLTPGTPYVIHGNWSAVGFPFATVCTPTSLCMTVTVDDLQAGCGPLPADTKTWGGVKALYNK